MADRTDAAAGDMAGVCANEEVAITVANRIVINDIKVFMAACYQLSVQADKCDHIYLVTDLKFFVTLQRPGRSLRAGLLGERAVVPKARSTALQSGSAAKHMRTAVARGNSRGKCIGVRFLP